MLGKKMRIAEDGISGGYKQFFLQNMTVVTYCFIFHYKTSSLLKYFYYDHEAKTRILSQPELL